VGKLSPPKERKDELQSFLVWLRRKGLILARLHVHSLSCTDGSTVICGYPEDSFEPLCLRDEWLVESYFAAQHEVPETKQLPIELKQ
jgi:hypothetical protein